MIEPGRMRRGRSSGSSGTGRELAGDDRAASQRGASALVTPFKTPKRSFGDLDAEAAASLIAATSDVALVLDRGGVIRDLAFGDAELAREWDGAWRGKAWISTVTVESRPKVEALLEAAVARAVPRWRHINHPSPRGADIPILYSALQAGTEGRVVVVGRDLRATAALQQRLVDVQQSLERDYSRLRNAETRYRLLFQTTAEAVLIVDAASEKVLEANTAAGHLLEAGAGRLAGRPVSDLFDRESASAVETLLAGVRVRGRTDDARARLSAGGRETLVTASLFRQDHASFFLVRLVPVEATSRRVADADALSLVEIARSAPDAIVVTGADGLIRTANAAFLDLAQLATEDQVRGESLDRWLGRPGVDLSVLLANLRQHGSVRLFSTTLRGEYGASVDIEVSAVSVSPDKEARLGFLIRSIARRPASDIRSRRELPRSVEQMTELVGRVPLKDLVRETTDVIERLCIEAALELTGDNRASAAEVLGLSRQSLYVKLRRYGLGDLGSEVED